MWFSDTEVARFEKLGRRSHIHVIHKRKVWPNTIVTRDANIDGKI